MIADLRPDDVDILKAFHRIQHEFGFVPPEAIPLLAGQFRTTPAIIYGTIDFYSEIRTAPPAETTVEWCSGPACLLKGSMNIRRSLESILECQMNRSSARREDSGCDWCSVTAPAIWRRCCGTRVATSGR